MGKGERIMAKGRITWTYNEWQGGESWDDKTHAIIEALREIAEILEDIHEKMKES